MDNLLLLDNLENFNMKYKDSKGRFVKGHTFHLGRKRSKETIEKMKESGKKRAKKMSEMFKGRNNYWLEGENNPNKKSEARKRISKQLKREWKSGKRKVSKNFLNEGKKYRKSFEKGHPSYLTPEMHKKIGYKLRKRIGKNSNNWKGGKTLLKKLMRGNIKYFEWRSKVFKRDNYHCQKCGEKGYLEAHHIIPIRNILDIFQIKKLEQALKCKELWNIGNGITLCKKCHAKIDIYRARLLEVKNV